MGRRQVGVPQPQAASGRSSGAPMYNDLGVVLSEWSELCGFTCVSWECLRVPETFQSIQWGIPTVSGQLWKSRCNSQSTSLLGTGCEQSDPIKGSGTIVSVADIFISLFNVHSISQLTCNSIPNSVIHHLKARLCALLFDKFNLGI